MGISLAMLAQGAQTGLGMLSASAQHKQDKATAKYNEAVLRLKGEAITASATEEQFKQREDIRRTVASNRAATAAGGGQFEGSPLVATMTAVNDAAYDIAVTGFNAQQEVREIESMIEMSRIGRKQASKAHRREQVGIALGGVMGAGKTLVAAGYGQKGKVSTQKKVKTPLQQHRNRYGAISK